MEIVFLGIKRTPKNRFSVATLGDQEAGQVLLLFIFIALFFQEPPVKICLL